MELSEVRELYRAGRFSDALPGARRAVAAGSMEAGLHYLLGLLETRAGEHLAAEAAFRSTLELDPDHKAARNSLAALLAADGSLEEALFHYGRVAERFPQDRFAGGEGLALLLDAGRLEDSAGWLARARDAGWREDELRLWTGRRLAREGRCADALQSWREIAEGAAEWAPARLESARLAAALGDRATAEECFRRLLEHDPRHPTARLELAALCCDHADPAAASSWLDAHRRELGDSIQAARFAALAAYMAGDAEQAAEILLHLASAAPNDPAVLHDAAQVLTGLGRRGEACELLRNVAPRGATGADAVVLLARLLVEEGRVEEARPRLEEFARARRRLAPAAGLAAEVLCPPVFASEVEVERYRSGVLARLTDPALPVVDLAEAVEVRLSPPFGWAHLGGSARPLREALAAKIRVPNHVLPNRSGGNRRRRLVIVVTAGHEGVFRRCMEGTLARWPAGRVEAVVAAPLRSREMLGLDRFPAVGFVPLPESAAAAALVLERLKADLLYYWEVGTDPLNYALALQRLAPVQFTSWGTQGTTGLPTIDYYLSSRWVEPPDAQSHYSEKLVLFSSLLTCISRLPIPSPPPAEPPRSGEAVRYVCIQNLLKIHPEEDARFRSLLERDPAARLVLKGNGCPAVAEQLAARLDRTLGDLRSRAEILPWLSRSAYLELVRDADVLLDTRCFSAGSTIYDIFSANRPLVVRPGAAAVGRYAAGCCRRLGLDELVADTDEAYLALAHRLAHDRPYRRRLHADLARLTPLIFEDANFVEELVDFCEAVQL